jgi:hypothetical protein
MFNILNPDVIAARVEVEYYRRYAALSEWRGWHHAYLSGWYTYTGMNIDVYFWR